MTAVVGYVLTGGFIYFQEVNMSSKLLFKIHLSIFICFTIIGCASKGSLTSTGEFVGDVMPVFKKGEIRLTCDIACSGAWGSNRKKMKGLYDQGLWHDLAITVANLGFRSDQTYYYLGRSAEELGYTDAALTYYKFAKISFKCDGLLNNCDGLVFPGDINSRVVQIERAAAERATTEKVAAERAAAEKRAIERATTKRATSGWSGYAEEENAFETRRRLLSEMSKDEVSIEKTTTEKVAAERAAAEKRAIERATTKRATSGWSGYAEEENASETRRRLLSEMSKDEVSINNTYSVKSDLDIEIEKIPYNPDQVNYIIFSKVLNIIDFNTFMSIAVDDRIELVEDAFYIVAFEKAQLQHNNNKILTDILNQYVDEENRSIVVKEFQRTYYDIYGKMPRLAFANSSAIKEYLIRR